MSTNYSWNIAALDCVPHSDGLTNIVKTVRWIRVADDGTHSASCYGSVTIPTPESADDFIPYENLTKETVESWLNTHVDVTATDTALANQIEALNNPPVVTPPLPWSNS